MTIKNTEINEEMVDAESMGDLSIDTHKIYRWRLNIWKLYLFQFFMGLHLISGVLLPFFLSWGKLTFIEVMMLQSYFTLMILLFEIPCGAIADYISRKFSLILGATVTAFAALIYGSYPNIIIFIIGESMWAFASAMISGSDQALLYDTLKKLEKEEEISKVTAKNRSFMLIGIGISAPIGSIIGARFSLNLTMILMFFPFAFATIISLTLKEPNHELVKDESEKFLTVIKSGFKTLKQNHILRILTIEMIVTESMVFLLIWTYALYLEAIGLQIFFYGFVSAAMTIIQIIFNNMVPKLDNKVTNKRRFLQVYTIIPGIGYILMAFVFFIPVSIPLIIVIIGLGFSRRIIFVKSINKQIETKNRATVLSTINMLSSLLRTILYPLIGYIVMWNLSLTFILLGTAIIIFSLLSKIENEYLT